MKIVNQTLVLGVIVCFSFTSNAQLHSSTKPSLFINTAAKLQAAVPELNKAFSANEGSTIQLNFADNFSFSGTIISSVKRYNNLSSVIIKSSLLDNTVMAISRRINDDDTITYVGRILNDSYADGYELKKSNDGNYAFHKIKTEELIQDY